MVSITVIVYPGMRFTVYNYLNSLFSVRESPSQDVKRHLRISIHHNTREKILLYPLVSRNETCQILAIH